MRFEANLKIVINHKRITDYQESRFFSGFFENGRENVPERLAIPDQINGYFSRENVLILSTQPKIKFNSTTTIRCRLKCII